MLKLTDVSSAQRGIKIKPLGVDGVIAKATGSTNYVNTYCDGFLTAAKKANMVRGAYHFAHDTGGNAGPAQEADWFLRNTKGYVGSTVFALDFETPNLIDTNHVDWAHQWLDRVYTQTGVKPLIYMPGWVVNHYDWSSVVKDDYGLWLAYWPTRPTGFTPGPLPTVARWSTLAMWQFTNRGKLPGWSNGLDLDVFTGDRAAWAAYAAVGGSKPAPVPTPTPKPAPAPKPTYGEYYWTIKKAHAYDGKGHRRIDCDLPKGHQHHGVIDTTHFNDGRYFRLYQKPHRLWFPLDSGAWSTTKGGKPITHK